MSYTGMWFSEAFVWWFLGRLVAVLAVMILIWAVGELLVWGTGKLRGGRAKGAMVDAKEDDDTIDLWADAYHDGKKAA